MNKQRLRLKIFSLGRYWVASLSVVKPITSSDPPPESKGCMVRFDMVILFSKSKSLFNLTEIYSDASSKSCFFDAEINHFSQKPKYRLSPSFCIS